MKKLSELITLEDLKLYYEAEAVKVGLIDDIENYLDSITNLFELSTAELNYVRNGFISLEEQTNKATLLNSTKAAQILLKRKKK